MSPRISLLSLKEFTVCVHLKLNFSNSPWTAYVYNQETTNSNPSAIKHDLGLSGDRGNLRIWLFGNQINTTVAMLQENIWHQICTQWKSEDKEVKLFINGKKRLNEKLIRNMSLPGKGQFLLGCSKLPGTAASPNQGMTGELYMFRMWDKANTNLAKHCRDGSIVRWRKEDWMFNKTVEKDNSLPCGKYHCFPVFRVASLQKVDVTCLTFCLLYFRKSFSIGHFCLFMEMVRICSSR